MIFRNPKPLLGQLFEIHKPLLGQLLLFGRPLPTTRATFEKMLLGQLLDFQIAVRATFGFFGRIFTHAGNAILNGENLKFK